MMPLRDRANQVNHLLERLYPEAKCELRYETPLQLLIATILSAQCTDTRVNQVTPRLFSKCQTCEDFANSQEGELETMIQSTGFFRNKAANIRNCCAQLLEKHGGQVPDTMEDLVALPGVGRKTANVVLGNAFGKPGLPVDTHVTRLSYRLGFTEQKNPVKIELDLHQLFPPQEWTMLGHRLIFHGRRICSSRSPKCDECQLSSLCPKKGVAAKKLKTKSPKGK